VENPRNRVNGGGGLKRTFWLTNFFVNNEQSWQNEVLAGILDHFCAAGEFFDKIVLFLLKLDAYGHHKIKQALVLSWKWTFFVENPNFLVKKWFFAKKFTNFSVNNERIDKKKTEKFVRWIDEN